MTSTFQVGERVISKAFVNCFGKPVAEVRNLVVESVTLHGVGYEPYFRVYAVSTESNPEVRSVEAAERFFAAEDGAA
jgi:hypothetical protein